MKYELRKIGETSRGFRYDTEDEFVPVTKEWLDEVCATWNSYTQETCPHARWLDGEKCQLCGNKYEVVEV